MIGLLKWVLRRAGVAVNPKAEFIRYETGDALALQDALLADIAAGRLKFQYAKSYHPYCVEHHWRAVNADVQLRVDGANIGGTFTFLYVQGSDMSYLLAPQFDLQRVSHAIRTGQDQGVTKHSSHWESLWHC